MEDSYLLELNLILFLKILKIFNEKKLKKQIELFRKFKCFDMVLLFNLYLAIRRLISQINKNNCNLIKT